MEQHTTSPQLSLIPDLTTTQGPKYPTHAKPLTTLTLNTLRLKNSLTSYRLRPRQSKSTLVSRESTSKNRRRKNCGTRDSRTYFQTPQNKKKNSLPF